MAIYYPPGAVSGTATVANGLKSATTTVVTSGATAPTAGQLLTATSGTAADWEAPPPKRTLLFSTGTSVGNGADLTEDTLQTFVVLANQLANVGDRLVIECGGVLAASTDSKTVRVRLNGASATASITASAVGQIVWTGRIVIMKTASNIQMTNTLMTTSTAVQTGGGQTGTTDTSAITITVTGQNATNSVSGSVTCRFMTVDYMAAS